MFNNLEERVQDFIDIIENDAEGDVVNLVLLNKPFMSFLTAGGFFATPASTKYHGAYEGGLYDHSRCVYNRLVLLTEKNDLKWQRPESPFIVGMFHDLCKCDQYTPVMKNEYKDNGHGALVLTPEIDHFEYATNTLLKGHGTKSVMLLSQFITLTEEEMLCIRYHMGAYGNEEEQKIEWAGFDAASRRTNGLCLYAHLADQLASKIDNI